MKYKIGIDKNISSSKSLLVERWIYRATREVAKDEGKLSARMQYR